MSEFNLLTKAAEIKNATQKGENTATRVGTWMEQAANQLSADYWILALVISYNRAPADELGVDVLGVSNFPEQVGFTREANTFTIYRGEELDFPQNTIAIYPSAIDGNDGTETRKQLTIATGQVFYGDPLEVSVYKSQVNTGQGNTHDVDLVFSGTQFSYVFPMLILVPKQNA